MKKLITILFLIISIASFGQVAPPSTPGTNARAGYITFPEDMNVSARANFLLPRYADTTTANLSTKLDTCGRLIWCYSDGNVYVRKCGVGVKYWAVMGGGGSGFTTATNGTNSISSSTIVLGNPSALNQYTPLVVGSFPVTVLNNASKSLLANDSSGIILNNNQQTTTTTDSLPSPTLTFLSYGRKTGGGAGSVPVAFRLHSVGLFSNPNGRGYLILESRTNTGTYTPRVYFDNTGDITSNTYNSLYYNIKTGGVNLGITDNLTMANTTGGSSFNVGIGGGSIMDSLTTGSFNVSVGWNGQTSNKTSNFNTSVGHNVLSLNTGQTNTAVGYRSMALNTTGEQNAAFGANALTANTTGQKNTALGTAAGEETTTGSFNTFVGQDAGLHNSTGDYNATIGWLSWSQNITGHENIGLGASTGRSVTNGYHNVALGNEAMYLDLGGVNRQKDTVTNSIAVGAHSYTTASNQMRLGNDSINATYIYGITHNNTNKLTVVMQDTTDNKMYHIPASQIVGATPTLQEVFATQSGTATMLTANTINSNANGFFITGGDVLQFNNKVGSSSRYSELLLGSPSDINMIAYNGTMTSSIFVVPDSIGLTPHLGKINIDTLRTATTQPRIMLIGNNGNGMVGALANGTAGQLLQTNGANTVPSWVSTSSLTGLPYVALTGTSTATGGIAVNMGAFTSSWSSGFAGWSLNPAGLTKFGDIDHNNNQTEISIDDASNNITLKNGANNLNVGINTSTPTVALDVVGDGMRFSGKTNYVDGLLSIGDATGSVIFGDGAFSVNGTQVSLDDAVATIQLTANNGTTFSSGTVTISNLSAGGAVTAGAGTGTLSVVSDGRLKHDISPYQFGLKEIMQTRPITFRYNEDQKMGNSLYAGFDARDIYKVYGSLGAGTDSKGYHSLFDKAILGASVNAIQELYQIIKDQQKQIDELKKIIKSKK